MEDSIEHLLLQLQKELESANVQYNNVSTMARIGNSQLVKAFFNESITLKLPSSMTAQTGMDMLQSYIYTCCFWGSRDTLKKIIDLADQYHLNIDLNAQNQMTLWTPLHAATFQEHGPIIMLLMDNGADPDVVDSEGWTPVHYASVSDKIWPHFASRGFQRVPLQVLVNKGLIANFPDQGVRSVSARGIELAFLCWLELANRAAIYYRQKGVFLAGVVLLVIEPADYDRPSSASSACSSAAVVNGDILATDDSSSMASEGPGRACNGYRLQNNIF